jgi:lysophospholipase L1-like esterase
MKRIILIASIFLFWAQVAGAQKAKKKSLFPANVHRILFLGNSITYAGKYITDIEAYFVTRYAPSGIEFVNAGLPSETVSGLSEPGHAGGKFPRPDLHERLGRVLAIVKPDLVFACYGMNDGIYLPLDQERFQKYKEGITWLHDAVEKIGAKIVHVTPPVFDRQSGKHPGYDAVLDAYADWLLEQKGAAGWAVADIHWPMKEYLDERRKSDSTFVLAKDGIHPGDEGHWLMAKHILLYLGAQDVRHAGGIKDLMLADPGHERIFDLVSQRQAIMKDAWLTASGHSRPGMKTGLPMKEAERKAAAIRKQIRTLAK